MRSATTRVTMLPVQNLWLALTSWKRRRPKNSPVIWVNCTRLSVLYIHITQTALQKVQHTVIAYSHHVVPLSFLFLLENLYLLMSKLHLLHPWSPTGHISAYFTMILHAKDLDCGSFLSCEHVQICFWQPTSLESILQSFFS